MFHRVKSETDYDTPETQQQDAAVSKAPAESKASLMEEAKQTSEEMTKASADTADAASKNLYQRAGSANSAAQRPTVQYATRPATKKAPSYSAPVAPKVEKPVEAAAVPEGDRRLTIGRGITMSGEIEYCDHLYVEGTVEAALKGASELEIAESGVFYGTVEIQDATIAGRFEGEMIVHGSLKLESTGVITGSLSYRELSVEAGAVIDGRIMPLAADQVMEQAPMPAAKAKKAEAVQSSNEDLFEAAE